MFGVEKITEENLPTCFFVQVRPNFVKHTFNTKEKLVHEIYFKINRQTNKQIKFFLLLWSLY